MKAVDKIYHRQLPNSKNWLGQLQFPLRIFSNPHSKQATHRQWSKIIPDTAPAFIGMALLSAWEEVR